MFNLMAIRRKKVVGYEVSFIPKSVGGRAAVALSSDLGLKVLDFGIGMGVDVGYQAWLDVGNPYLTSSQFRGRLIVTGVGSGISFLGGTVVGSIVEGMGLSTVGIFGGPAGWVAIGVSVIVAIGWEQFVTPVIYKYFGLNPERKLANLN